MRGWKPWSRQPPAGTPIDWDSPFAQDLRFAYLPTSPADLVGKRPIYYIGTQYPLTADGVGVSVAWGGAGSAYCLRDPALEPPYFSMGVYVHRTGTLGSYARPLGKTYHNGLNSPFLSYDVQWNSGTRTQDAIDGHLAIGTSLYSTTSSPNVGDGPQFVLWTYDGSYGRLYSQGTEVSNIGVVGTTGYDTSSTGNLIISGSSAAAAANEWVGNIYLGLVWGHALTPAQAALYSSNPWQIFYKRRRVYSIIASSGGNLTGSAAIVLGQSGTLLGNGTLTGSDTITFGQSGTLTGAGALSGSDSITFGQSGALTGSGALSGSSAITWGGSASLLGAGALGGTAAIIFTSSATPYSPGSIRGSASISLSALGTIKSLGNMPNVVGISYYQALEMLQSAGIYQPLVAYAFAPSQISVKWARSATLPPGFVTAQSLAAGAAVLPGSKLTLSIAQFPMNAVIDMPPDWQQVN